MWALKTGEAGEAISGQSEPTDTSTLGIPNSTQIKQSQHVDFQAGKELWAWSE